ncbi:hypothetical protein, partial [Roseburia faecis]
GSLHLAVNTRDWTFTSKISAMLGTLEKAYRIICDRLLFVPLNIELMQWFLHRHISRFPLQAAPVLPLLCVPVRCTYAFYICYCP